MIFNTKQKLIFTAKWAGLIYIFFILQLFLMPLLAVQEVVPNLILVLLIVTAINFGLEVALPISVVLALGQSNFVYDRFLLFGWLLAPLVTVISYPALGLSRHTLKIVHVILCTLYVEFINFFIFAFERGLNDLSDSFWILLLSPLFNGLLAFPVIFLQNKVFKLDD